jgi:hypothetical protein
MKDPYKFLMEGRAFDDGDRLDKLAAGLTALQHVFDGQFRALTDKKRLYEQDRQLFQARINRYEDGSFIAYLGLTYTGLQTVLPFVQGTPNIWEATKNAFDFLKTIYELAHQDKTVQITQDGTGNTAVTAGDVHINFHGPVYQIGTQIIGAVREMDNLLEGEEVKKIALEGPGASPVLVLTSDMKGLFQPPTRIEDTPVKLSCDIFDFNKYDKTGKARVTPDQAIPHGNYRFKNIGDQAVEDFILSMTESQVHLNCLIKYQNDPLTENNISEILVMNVVA